MMNSSKTLFFMCFGKLNVFPSHMLYLGRLPRYINSRTSIFITYPPIFDAYLGLCIGGGDAQTSLFPTTSSSSSGEMPRHFQE